MAWTMDEAAVLGEAKAKLERTRTTNALVCIAGVVASALTLLFAPGGVSVVFYGAVIAGGLYAVQADRRLKRLSSLPPGSPLNMATLGVRTFADPLAAQNRTAVIVLGALIGAVVLAMVVMVVVLG